MTFSRRRFVQAVGSGIVLQSALLKAERVSPSEAEPAPASGRASQVALVHGDDRRKNIQQALLSIDSQIMAGLRGKKNVLIKPNNVSTDRQLAATHVETLAAILDYLEPRFHGPVVIAESSAGDTLHGFESFHYDDLARERGPKKVQLVDLNREGRYQTVALLDADLHVAQARLAARVLDPDTFVISTAMLKTHNTVVATMSIKNMVLGSPLHSVPGELRWSDKRKYHVGIRQTHYNMVVTAQKLQPHWGLAVIDGFEGMEGAGPTNGTPVESHVAIASTDFVAADRVGLEVMGIDPTWVGYLTYCGQIGLGEYDLDKIQVVGTPVASVKGKYQLAPNIQQQLGWMGPMTQLPAQVGTLLNPQEWAYS